MQEFLSEKVHLLAPVRYSYLPPFDRPDLAKLSGATQFDRSLSL